MALWKLTHETFEVDGPLGLTHPMLVHIFFAPTRDEVVRIAKVHATTDSFFRDCSERGRFKAIACPTRQRIERVR